MEPKYRVETDSDGRFVVVDDDNLPLAWCEGLGQASIVATALNQKEYHLASMQKSIVMSALERKGLQKMYPEIISGRFFKQ